MWATRSAIAGTSWTAVAPVPITATRSLSKLWPWSHAAVWIALPLNSPTPGMSGSLAVLSAPVAVMRKRAVISSPPSVVTRQR